MARPQIVDAGRLSRSSPEGFLKAIFDGLICDGFRFPTSGNDGCIGSFCISKALPATIPGAHDRLALHLNFRCTPGNYKPGSLNLQIGHFHLTARAWRGQALINNAGASILTADESIHINRNGTWGRPNNCENLAARLEISREELIRGLTGPSGYTRHYMQWVAREMRKKIEQTVSVNIGQTKINWSGSDATFA